jgi:uncharacterized protein (DUF433 family)
MRLSPPAVETWVRVGETLEYSPELTMAINYGDRIVRVPGVAGGEAVIRGTRVTLRTLLASLAEGATVEEILGDFPTLTAEDVRAAIAFAAASAQEDLPLSEAPVKR